MAIKKALGSLALTASVAMMGGCVVRAHGAFVGPPPVAVVEVDEEPPPPRYVEVTARPGFIFIQGHWIRSGNRWVWHDGYWERERAGYYWEQGRWENRGRRHVWVQGSWRAGNRGNGGGGGPAVRDHRHGPPPRSGPVVRDHRH